MSAHTLDSLLDGAGELSSLPDSWQRIDVVISRPAANTAQIAEAIASDPALSLRLLRMANSPMFGLSQRVERLSQAVHLIGTRQLRELALAASIIDMLAGSGRRERVVAFLRHSTATALFARALASRRREPNVERVFVAGLLHDLGGFVIEQADPNLAAANLATAMAQGKPLEQVEHNALGFDHATLGGALIERWKLPLSLSEPVAYHHQPAAAQTHRIEAALVHIAAIAVDLLGFSGEGPVCTPLDTKAWELSGIDPGELPAVASDMDAALAPMIEILAGDAA